MNIIKTLKTFISAIKYGGYNEILISQINYNQCLAKKNILVTGASSGIGFEIAKKCCCCGANVIITGRNEEKLRSAKEAIAKRINYITWDQSEINVIQEKLQTVLALFNGRIDCLVNNAGIQPCEFFPNVSENEWEMLYNTNSKGMFFLTQELCKYWLKQKRDKAYKKIINIDSQGGFVGATYPYRMVKWDIRGLTRGLGLKLAEEGILVNAIAPGVVKTRMQQFSLEQGDNAYCNQNLLKRVCLPEEIAEMAIFMISDACNFMVGQTVLIDGGYSLK